MAEARLWQRRLKGTEIFRIIPTRYPPIRLYERLVDPDELEYLYALEARTNDRLRAEAGELYRLPKSQWVTGPGASIVMAAFTHRARPSRFSDGSYGVYYAALEEQTAIAETVFHRERFLRASKEPRRDLDMRCYAGTAEASLDNITGPKFAEYRNPDLGTYPRCQIFGAERRAAQSNGLYYKSARRAGGLCVAAFRPKAVSRPRQSAHYRYLWDGEHITEVLRVDEVWSR